MASSAGRCVADERPDAVSGTVVVAIGRNEGERLKACLRSALPQADLVVYVDSGSTDGSVEFATEAGCEVVVLDERVPFTAARARNAGFQHAISSDRHFDYVQFVDGDCEIRSDWIATAADFLTERADVAAVCGRRRERYPARTIYNQLCDWEWAVAPGEAKYCGGDVMLRVDALQDVGGYRDDLIAGEEPELCVRLRAAGWRIHVLDAEMTLHDAAMTHFGQWWKRMMRSGYAYAAGTALHGGAPERHWVRQTLRPWLWVVLPLTLMALLMPFAGALGLVVLLIYPMQVLRLSMRGAGDFRSRILSSYFNTLARFPELLGQFQFVKDSVAGQAKIIEYK